MKALTVWQPWASLIMIGAKPLEFRQWDYRERYPAIENTRIVIHAAAREIKPFEIYDLIKRCEENDTSLIPEKALPLLHKIFDARKCRGVVNLSAALGTARICAAHSVDRTFKKPDSDRLHHHMFAWPLKDIEPFAEPIPMNGAQGFWNAHIPAVAA
jgi:hypothetical protein